MIHSLLLTTHLNHDLWLDFRIQYHIFIRLKSLGWSKTFGCCFSDDCYDCDDNCFCNSFEQWNSCSDFLYFTIFELSLVLSKDRFQIDACETASGWLLSLRFDKLISIWKHCQVTFHMVERQLLTVSNLVYDSKDVTWLLLWQTIHVTPTCQPHIIQFR